MDKQNIGIIINEMKKFISEEEMKKFKTNNEHEKYYLDAFEKIGTKDEYIKISRLRKKPTRYFYEEFSTLIDYVNIKYKQDNGIVWKWCGDEIPEPNLRYDGIIKRNNEIIEKVEITCPLHWREDIVAGEFLNKTGTYCYEVMYVDDYELECKNKIIDDVIKKNNKNTYDESITLLIVFDDYHFLPSEKLQDKYFIESMFKNLKSIDYIFKNVYILMNKYEGSNLKYDSYLIRIK